MAAVSVAGRAPRSYVAAGRLLLAVLALAFALYGQSRVAHADLKLGTRCYALAIIIWLVAAGGSDSEEHRRARSSVGSELVRRHGMGSLLLWIPLSLGLNLVGVRQLHVTQYGSTAGGLLWLASLASLLIAFHRVSPNMPKEPLAPANSEIKSRHWPPRLETLVFLAILLLAFSFRFYRIGDWTTGVHGDEGEAGLAALQILDGHPVSPFRTGWAEQSNFYYWGIALCMKLAGTGLAGLRTFSALCGLLVLLPLYGLARLLFGVRTALLASGLLAVSDLAVHLSRIEFSNITTALFIVLGFWFFVRGLCTTRALFMVLAGYAHSAGLYFYQGSRLTPLIGAAFVTYLVLSIPLSRLALRFRRRSAVDDFRQSWRAQVRRLALPVAAYTLAGVCFASPWLAYSVDHWAEASGRAKDKLVFNNPERMVTAHHVQHGPLYVGLTVPRAAQTLPVPIAFAKTSVAIRLSRDGFWPRVLWGQLTASLSALTYRPDGCETYTFTREPVVKPTEAALIVLGIAWSLWRFRDPRFALLSIWFWCTILVGGMLTIDAPCIIRLIGMVPVLPLFAAVVLNQLASRFEEAAAAGRSKWLQRRVPFLTATGLAALLVFLTWQNYYDYFHRYLERNPLPYSGSTGQAVFVREMNRRVAAEGRTRPRYFSLGSHGVYWGYGVNRFLNRDTPGTDMANPANDLPLTDRADSDVIFMIWDNNRQYLPILKLFYPEGIEEPFFYGAPKEPDLILTSYRIKKEDLISRQVSRATYVPAAGRSLSRDEPGLGTSNPPPVDLEYPVKARWVGSIFAPEFSRYRFQIISPSQTTFEIDGQRLTEHPPGAGVAGELILARGLHAIELKTELPSRTARVEVLWSAEDATPARVPRRFLWLGPGRSLLGEIRALPEGSPAEIAFDNDTARERFPLIARRVDSFLGFRDSSTALSQGMPFMGCWKGSLEIRNSGRYSFYVDSNGPSVLRIDRTTVVDSRNLTSNVGTTIPSQIDLAKGRHSLELLYVWRTNFGALELFWAPPGGQRRLLGPEELEVVGSAWPPGPSLPTR
jgi:4-amino-4-deoxy-L-arabinose transferase-like glycosyltransferase